MAGIAALKVSFDGGCGLFGGGAERAGNIYFYLAFRNQWLLDRRKDLKLIISPFKICKSEVLYFFGGAAPMHAPFSQLETNYSEDSNSPGLTRPRVNTEADLTWSGPLGPKLWLLIISPLVAETVSDRRANICTRNCEFSHSVWTWVHHRARDTRREQSEIAFFKRNETKFRYA